MMQRPRTMMIMITLIAPQGQPVAAAAAGV
jgi:hypothetical protein